MIAIVNVGPHDDPDKLGVRTYEVRINANVVCTFKHRRADGLGMCLLKASKAVERQKWEQASRILDIANVRGLDRPTAVPAGHSSVRRRVHSGSLWAVARTPLFSAFLFHFHAWRPQKPKNRPKKRVFRLVEPDFSIFRPFFHIFGVAEAFCRPFRVFLLG